MVTDELLSYIKGQLDSGISRDAITDALAKQGGWDPADVAQAFAKIGQAGVAENPVEPEPAPIETPAGAEAKPAAVAQDTSATGGGGLYDTGGAAPEVAEGAPVKKQGAGLKIALVVTIILLLLGGSAYAYYTFVSSKQKTPFEVLSLMMYNIQGITSVHEVGEFSVGATVRVPVPVPQDPFATTTPDVPEMTYVDANMDMSAVYDITYDATDPKNIQSEGQVELSAGGSYSFVSLNFEMTLMEKFTDNTLYLKLVDMTPLPIPVDLSPVQNKWIKFDFSEIAEETGMSFEQSLTLQEDIQQVIVEEMVAQMSGPEMQAILERSVTDLDEEGVNKEEYLYRIKLTAEDWKTIITLLFETITSVEGFYVEGLTEEDLQEWQENVRTELASADAANIYAMLAKSTIDMTIHRETLMPINVAFTLPESEFSVDDVSGTVEMSLTEGYDKYNKAMPVEAPTQFMTIEEALSQYGFSTTLMMDDEMGTGTPMMEEMMEEELESVE